MILVCWSNSPQLFSVLRMAAGCAEPSFSSYHQKLSNKRKWQPVREEDACLVATRRHRALCRPSEYCFTALLNTVGWLGRPVQIALALKPSLSSVVLRDRGSQDRIQGAQACFFSKPEDCILIYKLVHCWIIFDYFGPQSWTFFPA